MTTASRRSSDELGMSLIEVVVAMFILSVAMLAFAQVLIGSARATREAQDTQVVSAVSMETIETLTGLDWHEAALYANDVAGADARWSSRLDGSGDFEGMELVTVAGPASAADRDPEIPTPSWTVTRDGLDYTFDLYPVWLDRSATADGIADTKRFVIVASWTDPLRGDQELRTASERAPTQAEAGSTSTGARFLLKTASPSLVDVDGTTGQMNDKVSFAARTNVPLSGSVTATLTWDEPTLDADGNVTGYNTITETVTLGPTTAAASGVGWIEFAGDFNGRVGNVSTNGKYRFPNGEVNVELTGSPVDGGPPVTGSLAFTIRNSPYGPPEPSPDPTETEVDYGYTADPAITSIDLPAFCASSNKWELGSDLIITVTLKNIEPPSGTEGTETYQAADAVVTVSYPYWSNKQGNIDDPDKVGSISAEFASGTRDSSTWTARIPADSDNLFRPDKEINASVNVTRSSDDESVSGISAQRTVGTC